MKVGIYEIPDFRLPVCIQDIKKIYDNNKFEKISSKDLAQLLGYKAPTSGTFYMKLKSLMVYGLIESRGGNYVTELGYKIAYPDSPQEEEQVKKKIIFHVPLWKQLYKTIKTDPPAEFWLPLKNSAGIDAPEAHKHATTIKKWYMEDISTVSKEVLESDEVGESKDLSSSSVPSKVVSQQIAQIDPNSFGRLSVKGIGDIDLTDDDTITLAESALKILRKKLPSLKSKQENEDSTESGFEQI